jgi:chromosome condensin MukBEF MukE localization factor
MVLEEIDFLVETIVCHITLGSEDSVVEIIFTSEDAYAAIFATWSSLSEFILVTSHQSCNPNDQRGAWL